jgi:uncharacterized membrane protein YgdD (TMEM256/DUF423 family)
MDHWLRTAGYLGATAVAIGAFGAHALQNLPPKDHATFMTGANYQLIHSVALGVAALSKNERASQLLFTGTVVFSGSLYLVVLTGYKKFGMIAPIGGFALIGGWLCLALGL